MNKQLKSLCFGYQNFKKSYLSFKLIFSLILILSTSLSFAQKSNKIAPSYNYLIDRTQRREVKTTIPELYKLDVVKGLNPSTGVYEDGYICIIYTKFPEVLKANGIAIQSTYPTYVTAWVTLAQIPIIADLEGVEFIDAPKIIMPNNDISVGSSGASLLHAGKINNTVYKGDGVIVAIVDSGIDWDHPDFRSSTDQTKSRILRIWDQTITPISGEVSPSGFNYGVEYTQTQINNEIDDSPAGFVREKDINGHGTHVAGTAAGNGAALSTFKYTGIAPNADIVVVKGGNGGFTTTNIINSLTYLQNLATTLAKPIVVNMSLGGQSGAHDGTDPQEIAVDAFSNSAPGRVVVIASGNDNGNAIHKQNSLTSKGNTTVSFVVPTASASTSTDVFQFTCYANDASAINATITAPDGTTATVNAGSGWAYSIMAGLATVNFSNSIDAGSGDRMINVYLVRANTAANVAGIWTLTLTNSTSNALTIDGWLNYKGKDFTTTTLSSGDSNFLIGSPGCANNAITVGSYMAKLDWSSSAGSQFMSSSTSQQDNISSFSSIGPRRDNSQKPDITANGQQVVSCLSSDSGLTNTSPYMLVNGLYVAKQGTSMATPAVAGCVALLLQINKNATYSQIKTALTSTATKDVFTTASDNNIWGSGKIDVFKAASSQLYCNTLNRVTYSYDAAYTATYNLEINLQALKATTRFTPAIDGQLGGVYFKTGSTVTLTSFTIEVRTNSAGVPGTLLNSLSVTPSSVSKFSWNYYNLSSLNIPVTSGTDYFIVLVPGVSSTFSLGRDPASVGRSFYYNGASWTATTDLRIRSVVYTTGNLVPSIALSSASATNAQTQCINTAITNITYATVGATGATFSGLPTGVTGAWASNIVTISGTPTVAGTYDYTVTSTVGCYAATATGSIVVNANTATLSSAVGTNAQTKCISTAIIDITYTTTGATAATFSGLPTGVSGNWTDNLVTISGTPSVAGTYNYIITLTGGCSITVTGTIIVNAIATATAGVTNSVCQSASPAAFALTGSSVGGSATTGSWSIISGGGTLSSTNQTTSPATVTYTPAANYSGTVILRLTSNFGTGCSAATVDRTIIVNTVATATSGGPNSVCQSASPIAFALTGASVGGSATTGAWSIISGGGTLSSTAQTATPATVTYTPAANYTGIVTLRLTSNFVTGCSAAIADRTVNVNASSAASISIVSSDIDNIICSGTSITFTATPTNGGTSPSYQWYVGTTAVGANSTTFVTSALTTGQVVKVVMTTSNTCATGSPATSNTITTTVNAATTATAGSPNSVCQSASPVAFALAGASVGGSATTGAWSIISGGGTLSSTAQTATPGAVTYRPIANYTGTVTLRLTSNFGPGCSAATADRTVNVNANSAASVSIISSDIDNIICLGTSIIFTATPTNGGTSPSYQWYIGTTAVGVNSNTFVTSALTTGQVVKVVMTGSNTCATGSPATSNTITTTVNAATTATAGGSNSVCQSASPVAFALAGASIGGSATTGAWSMISGGGTLSSTAQTATPATVTYKPAANYTGIVTLRLTSNFGTACSAATADKVINVVSPPILSANTGGALTVNTNASTPAFANVQAGGIWSIVAGTGAASITSDGVVTGLTAGTVIVVYTYSNACGNATKSNTVTVVPSITGVISGSTTICAGTPTQLSISLTGEGPWFGTLSDGTGFSGSDNPLLVTVTPTTNTTYTITTLSGEKATASIENLSGGAEITVNPLPIVSIGNERTAILFQDFESGILPQGWSATGLWHISNTCTTGTIPNRTKWAYYGQEGTCTYNNGSTNSGDLTSNSITIPVNSDSPKLSFRYAYNGEGGSPPIGWDNASLKISVNGNPFIPVASLSDTGSSGSWISTEISLNEYKGSTITLQWNFNTMDGTSNDALGLEVDDVTITELTSSQSTALCSGTTTTLEAGEGFESYLWSNGATTPSITISSAGDYTVTVTNSSGCSATSAATSVTSYSLSPPTITASGSTTLCQGSNVTLSAGEGFNSYLWSNGITTSSIEVSLAGDYTVTVTNSYGCSATSAATVVTSYTLSTPTITASGSTTLCQGGNVTLSAAAGLPLNTVGRATLAVGLRKLKSAYVGSALRLRRSSDNEEQNFGFAGNDLDTDAISTWLDGADGFCTTLYDQSGNGVNVTQTSQIAQPLLVVSGINNKPILHFNTNQYMNNEVNYPAPYSAIYGSRVTGVAKRMLSSVYNNWLLGYWGSSQDAAFFGDNWVSEPIIPTVINQYNIYASTGTGSVSTFYKNGIQLVSNSNSLEGPNGIRLNGWAPNENEESSDGDFTDVIVFGTALSSQDIANLNTSISNYYTTNNSSNNIVSYLWSNGATTPSIEVTTAGDYTVTVTNTNGCSVSSIATTVFVNHPTTETTVVTSCGMYIWDLTNSDYMESGTYRYTENCVEHILELTVIEPTADAPSDVTACDSYTLPALSSGNYFTGTGGTGTAKFAGDVISSSTTLFVYASSGTTANCTAEHSFTITITPSSVHTTTVITTLPSYDWNEQLYSESGVYTGSTTNCVTEQLNLAINDSYVWWGNQELFVVTPTGTILVLSVEGSMFVNEVKQSIQNILDIPISDQILTFAGKELDNWKTIADYNIQKRSTTYLTISTLSPSTISVTGQSSFIYNGTAQGPETSSVTGSTGTVTDIYKGIGSTDYFRRSSKPTEVGTYAVIASVARDDDYKSAASEPFSFEIVACDNVGLASATATASSICVDATTTLMYSGLTGTNASVTWTQFEDGTGTTYGLGTPSSPVGPGTYYAYATGDCGSAVAIAVTVAITPKANPTFTQLASVCSGATLGSLPTTSVNEIEGTWSPALNTVETTEYTFTPAEGQCATTATMTITVNPNVLYYADNDGDGFGNPAVSQQSCTGAPTGYVTNNTDCNDNNNAATTAAVISEQPTNATICKSIGASATISVSVEGDTSTYQWYSQAATATTWTALSNNANYSGATSATLNITKTTTTVPATGTKYKVVVTNSCGTLSSAFASITDVMVLSKAATIAVVNKLSPALTVCEGNSVNLSVAAGSVGNIQWQSSTDGITYQNVGDLIAQSALSATNAALPLNTGVLSQTTWFRVVASNGVCSSVNGAAIRITVSSPAVAGSISGGDITVCAPISTGLDTNGNALTAPITNSTTLTLSDYTAGATILWQKSTNFNTASPTWSVAGSTTNTVIATNLTTDTWYRALVTNGACSAPTAVTKITVNKAAKAGAIISAPSVCIGGEITFTSAAYMGTAIQWEVSTTSATTGFELVEGATAASFTMNNIGYVPLSKFYVRSVVTNGDCTSARSAVKTIMVNPLSVAGTIKGGGILCSNGGSTVSVLGNTGTIQWQYSTDGITYADAPYYKTVLGVPTYVNPNGTTEFIVPTTTTGIGATYVFTNFNALGTVYFRAKIKSGACSEAYTSPVQYVNGLLAVAGTISAAEAIICPATGTTLTLTGAVGAIQWQKATISATTRLPGVFASINGQTGTTLFTGNLTASTAYRALVTIGDCSTVTAAYVPVVVVEKPITKNSTTNKTIPAGTNAAPLCTTSPQKVLTIGPGSTGVIQWQKSTTSATTGFTDIEGANDSSYIVANPAAGVNYYRAKFTTSCGLSMYNTAVSLHYKNCSVIAKVAETKVVPAVAVVPFDVMAYPNPFSNTFNLQVITTSTANVEVNVYDASSRLIDRFEVSSAEVSGLHIGDNYPVGTYNLIVSQGTEMKTVRVIKK